MEGALCAQTNTFPGSSAVEQRAVEKKGSPDNGIPNRVCQNKEPMPTEESISYKQ